MSIDLSLERITKLLSYVHPYTRPTCHIAGTNGKGSVSALLSSILTASSYRVGRFNSPHLISIYDCITIDNVPVSAAVYADVRQRVVHADATLALHSTNFELLACTALVVLEEAQVDIAVVEVGMGGRLDATNVIPDDCILVSAVTAVDLDHQSFLGDTVAKIAREKTGIARRGKPLVLGPQVHPVVEAVVHEVVGEVGGTVLRSVVPTTRSWDPSVDGPFAPVTFFRPAVLHELPPQPVEVTLPPFSEPLRVLLPLQGEHQLANLGIVLTMVSALLTRCTKSELRFAEEITIDTIRRGIRATRWPGRLSLHTVPLPSPAISEKSQQLHKEGLVLADGAHNPSSSATLASYLNALLTESSRHSPSPRTVTLTFLLGLSRSPPKTPTQTLTPLLAVRPPPSVTVRTRVGLLRFTTPDGMPWIKSESPSDLRRVVASLLPAAEIWGTEDNEPAEGQMAAALAWAGEQSSEEEEHLIVVAGSLYLVADFYRFLDDKARTLA